LTVLHGKTALPVTDAYTVALLPPQAEWYLGNRYSLEDYISKIQKSSLAIAGYRGTGKFNG